MFSVEYSCFCICELQAKLLWRVGSNYGTSSESVSLVMTQIPFGKEQLWHKNKPSASVLKLRKSCESTSPWLTIFDASSRVFTKWFHQFSMGFSPVSLHLFNWNHVFNCFTCHGEGDCPMHGKRKKCFSRKKTCFNIKSIAFSPSSQWSGARKPRRSRGICMQPCFGKSQMFSHQKCAKMFQKGSIWKRKYQCWETWAKKNIL